MTKPSSLLPALAGLLLLAAPAARASTYGDNLLGIGTGARALAGTGTAAPQDVTGALTANPATLSFLTRPQPGPRTVEVSATFFRPRVSARVGAVAADSAGKTYVIPALALATAAPTAGRPWTWGLAAYGVSGMGVDYRATALDAPLAPTPFPLVAGVRTELQVLTVAPAVAYRCSAEWSVGLALQLNRGRLDLGSGAKSGLGAGVLPGLAYRASERLTLGLAYVAPIALTYRGVTDFDGDGAADDLRLESPQQFKVGAGYEVLPGRLLLAADAQWVNWGRARGYRDFDWRDIWVVALGVQYRAWHDRLTLRAGYARNGNPVRAHQGWDGTGTPANVTVVQGKRVNNYYYETFRIVGFPAIVVQHVSVGAAWRLGADTTLALGYTHAFRHRITESGTNLLGAPVTLSSTLSEDSFELEFARRF
ncbi:MAG: outer membrane protein transport protein [Opitutae bacterium]|nr:outer membrane protein transport protein [Opitutae bacterium]